MIVLLVIAGVLLLLLLLLLIPLGLEAEYRQGFTLRLRYLWFTIPLLPGEEEEAPAGSPAPEEEAGPGGLGALKRGWNKLRAILRREGLEGFLQSLLDFTQAVRDSSQRLLRHVKLKRFDLYLCVAGEEDAAQGAVLYGKVSAGVYAACGALFGLLPCRKKGVTVDLDYGAREHRIDFSGKLTASPLFLLREAVVLLWKGLPLFKKLQARGGRGHTSETVKREREDFPHE